MLKVWLIRFEAHGRGLAITQAMRQLFSSRVFVSPLGQFTTKIRSKAHLPADRRHFAEFLPYLHKRLNLPGAWKAVDQATIPVRPIVKMTKGRRALASEDVAQFPQIVFA